MTREQTVIKVADSELPVRAFDELGFWVLVMIVLAAFLWWADRR